MTASEPNIAKPQNFAPDDSAARDLFDRAKNARQFLLDEFLNIDKDGDRKVTSGELRQYKYHAKNAGQQKSIDFLKDREGEIGTADGAYSHDEDFTLYLMQHDPDLRKKAATVKEFEDIFKKHIHKWDLDGDKLLEDFELVAAARDPNMDAGAKYMVDFLQRQSSMVSNLDSYDLAAPVNFAGKVIPFYRDGISRNDLRELATEFTPSNEFEDALWARSQFAGASAAAGAAAGVIAVAAVLSAPVSIPALVGLGLLGYMVGAKIQMDHDFPTFENTMRETWKTLDAMGPPAS